MTPILIKSLAGLVAAAGLAVSVDAPSGPAYPETGLRALTEDAAVASAARVFARSDRDQSGYLDADEYTALQVVSAELARLNGFISVESDGEPSIITVSTGPSASLGEAEQIRIAAVARGAFYLAAGDDGRLDEAEFIAAERQAFEAADANRNGELARRELSEYAARAAGLSSGA